MARQGSRVFGLLCAAAVALLGTVNLWKVSSIQDRFPINLTLAAAVLATTLTLGAWALKGLRVERHWAPLLIGFASFVPALFLTSGANPYSAEKPVSLFTLSLLSAAAPMLLLANEQRRRSFLTTLTILGLALSTWLLLGGSASSSGRITIEDGNPIGLARVACLAFVILGFTALRSKGIRRLLAIGGLAVSSVASVTTGSRGPMAAAVAALVLVTLLSRRGQSRFGTITGLFVLAVAGWLAVTQFVPASALDRVATAQAGGDAPRIRLLTESAQIFWDHPWGVGWGDLGNYLSLFARIDAQGYRQYPHNVIAEVAAEGGIFALAGLMILIVVSWRRLRAASTTPTGEALLGLWILAVGSAMTSSDVVGNRLMWMMIGVGLALPLPVRPAKQRKSPHTLMPGGRAPRSTPAAEYRTPDMAQSDEAARRAQPIV